jgi:uncharacterized protein (DUF433 family)
MTELHRVTFDPEQCGGRPCIRGLRIRVKDVLDLLASGASREEILKDYPSLEPEDITAALQYAARQTDHPVLHVD